MLTPKQARFVTEYMIDLNATQAAIRAGYSEKAAHVQCAKLLKNPEIASAIDVAKIERSDRTGVDADYVLHRLVAEAEADIGDLYDENDNLKPVDEWPLIWRKGLVQGIESRETKDNEGNATSTVVRIRLSDRGRRLELIGKHVRVNAFQDQVAVTGLDALGERLDRAARALRARPVPRLVIDAPSQSVAAERPSAALPAAPAPVAEPVPAARPTERSIVNPATQTVADWEARPAAPEPYISPIWPEQPASAFADYDSFDLIKARE